MTKTKKERVGEWVTMRGNMATCNRCGRTHILDLPLTIKAAYTIMAGYVEQHRYCRVSRRKGEGERG